LAVSGGRGAKDRLCCESSELHQRQRERGPGDREQMQTGIFAFRKRERDSAKQDQAEECYQRVVRLVVLTKAAPFKEMAPAGLDGDDAKRESEHERGGSEIADQAAGILHLISHLASLSSYTTFRAQRGISIG
jgi:hypothetical protein